MSASLWRISAGSQHNRGGKRFGYPQIFNLICILYPEALSSSFLGLPYRILNINHKKELLRGLWVVTEACFAFTLWPEGEASAAVLGAAPAQRP